MHIFGERGNEEGGNEDEGEEVALHVKCLSCRLQRNMASVCKTIFVAAV